MLKSTGQVLTDIKHGGHVLEPGTPGADVLAQEQEGITVAPLEVTFETPFAYLFPQLSTDASALLPADDPAQVVENLKKLGAAMIEKALAPGENGLQEAGNSTVPPVYTYWGQFIDHDLTANTDRNSEISDITRPDLAPLAPGFITSNLKNLRQPTVNIDSVYGDGPALGAATTEAADFYDGIKFKIGAVATTSLDPSNPIQGVRIPPDDDLNRDLPRKNKVAQIADARNDENLIVAQFHLNFLRFHNAVVDNLKANVSNYGQNDYGQTDAQIFARARQLTTWHHQWLVLHDFLPTITSHGVADKVLVGGAKFFKPGAQIFMPLEFSVAAYRFGHSLVRAAYDFNRNFGRSNGTDQGEVLDNAPFRFIFTFTGNGEFAGQTNELPFNWIIEWDRFLDKGSSIPDHFARKFDTNLAPPLHELLNEGNAPGIGANISQLLKDLAARNLLRGYLLSIPTGQAVAGAMGIAPLSEAELRQNNTPELNQALEDGGFLARTPLWYYVLKEAEVRAGGNALGELGSRIVAETIIGQLQADPDSYLNHPGGWDPSQGVKLPNGDPIVTIRDFIQFAGIPA